MIRLLKPRRGAVKTITLDNGSEFTSHDVVASAVTAAVYFCDPYCSWQRGTNENTNGLIRQHFPKGTDFRKITDAELRHTHGGARTYHQEQNALRSKLLNVHSQWRCRCGNTGGTHRP